MAGPRRADLPTSAPCAATRRPPSWYLLLAGGVALWPIEEGVAIERFPLTRHACTSVVARLALSYSTLYPPRPPFYLGVLVQASLERSGNELYHFDANHDYFLLILFKHLVTYFCRVLDVDRKNYPESLWLQVCRLCCCPVLLAAFAGVLFAAFACATRPAGWCRGFFLGW